MFMYIIFDILKDFFAETKQVSLTVIFFSKRFLAREERLRRKRELYVLIYTYVLWAKSFIDLIFFHFFFRNISETMEVKDQVSLIAIGKKHTCL